MQTDINKVLIIGAGPNIVGEVAEFDLVTKQAIDGFLEDNVKVVIVNPNPATVATDPIKNVTVYLEPMKIDFVKRILRMERPDAIVTAFGSYVSLKMAKQLLEDGIIDELNIQLLTINRQTLEVIDHKHQVIEKLSANNIPCSKTFDLGGSVNELKEHLEQIQFPVIVYKETRTNHNQYHKISSEEELLSYIQLESEQPNYQPENYQIYEDLSDWEEVLVDVVVDNEGNTNFVNFAGSIEPLRINSGDSALVSPVLTLNNTQVQQLRQISKKIVQIFDHHGILSIHFAINHHGDQAEIKVLSMRPRITRSALMAYRVGFYTIGYVVAKIALGDHLNEIFDPNSSLNAAIEPVLDAVAIKLPNWSFTKAGDTYYQLSDQMQASGEVIGIDRNFEAALMKGISATNSNQHNFNIFMQYYEMNEADLIDSLSLHTEHHFIQIITALVRGISVQKIRTIIDIHPVYLQKIANIANLISELLQTDLNNLSPELLENAKAAGFENFTIAKLTKTTETKIQNLLNLNQISPGFVRMDGSAGLYPANSSSVYLSYRGQDEILPIEQNNQRPKILVIGLGPFEISLNSEFDYMLYHAIESMKKLGYEPIILSNNSEAISSGYLHVARVYFDTVSLENILRICQKEGINSLLTQFSGKSVNSMLPALEKAGLNIIGRNKDHEMILEDEFSLNNFVKSQDINLIPALTTETEEDAINFANEVGFPVLVGGKSHNYPQKSAVIYDFDALKEYIDSNELTIINISKFINGQKYEVTAISDGQTVTIPGIIEHLEQSGSHASDSIAIFSPQTLSNEHRRVMRDMTVELARQIGTKGFLTLHFLVYNNETFLLQVKTYAGHNVAFLAKALKIDIVEIATQVLLGQNLAEMGYSNDIWPVNQLIHVKMPVFSYLNYTGSQNIFDSKMKANGSVMGRDTRLSKALYKGYEGSGLIIPTYGTVFISVNNEEKHDIINIAERYHRLGFQIVSTKGTANILAEKGITVKVVPKLSSDSRNILEKLENHKINMVINLTSYSDVENHDAIIIKDVALRNHIPVFSSKKTTKYILEVLESLALTTQPI